MPRTLHFDVEGQATQLGPHHGCSNPCSKMEAKARAQAKYERWAYHKKQRDEAVLCLDYITLDPSGDGREVKALWERIGRALKAVDRTQLGKKQQ